MTDYDIIIAGAGVVGLALASELSQKGYSILVIEKHPSFGNETSSRNSEVIHAGIYYDNNSLKAKLCVLGNSLLYDWCYENNIPYKRTGKYIIAVNKDEEFRLNDIYRNAIDNQATGLRFADGDEVVANNLGVICTKAIYSANSGIVNSHILMESFINKSTENDCQFAYNHKVKKVEFTDNIFITSVEDTDGENFTVSSKYFINSAGLGADILAENAGINIDLASYRLKYCKGHYFKIRPGLSGIANNLIYPVPPVNYAGLGVHITLDLSGNLKLGPDTLYLDSREYDYSVSEILAEKFYEAAKRYIPELKLEDISPDQSGIRPKLQGKGEPTRDFIIKDEKEFGLPGFINLIGIESPGLTSCIAIAKYVFNNFIKK
jgi:L-2-hydroxyglutarate oxidase LhgO